MSRGTLGLALLLLCACRDPEREAEERAREHLDSLVENRDARPAAPLEFEDVRLGAPADTLPAGPDSARR